MADKVMPKAVQRPVDLSKAVDDELLVERIFLVRADELQKNEERTIPVVFSAVSILNTRSGSGVNILSHDSGAIDLSAL